MTSVQLLQDFAGDLLKDGCTSVLLFLKRCLAVEECQKDPEKPVCALAFQGFLELFELVISIMLPGLGHLIFVPQAYIKIQVSSATDYGCPPSSDDQQHRVVWM